MSNRQRNYRTQAVVLRRRDQGEADRVLTLFTPSDGKVDLIAKGIRKTTSRKAGHVELFTHISLMAAKARTWDILTEVTTVESFRHVRENLEHIGRAAYAAELIDCFSGEDDENQPLWDLLLLLLRQLDHHATVTESVADGVTGSVEEKAAEKATEKFDINILMRWFEVHLLGVTGFQPQFFYCIGSGDALQAETNYLSIAEGGVFGPKMGHARDDVEPLQPEILKILRYLQSRRWQDVQALTVKTATMNRVENILYRMLLNVLERQLKSVDFLRKLKQNQHAYS